MMRLTPLWYGTALFLAAFLIRLIAVLALRDVHTGPIGISSDDNVEFNRLARELSRGEGFVGERGDPTAFRAPGLPFVLAGVYALVGLHAEAAYLLFCLLGAASCVLTWAMVRELLSERAARVAGVLAAVYLGDIYFAATFLSENVFVPCLALGLWLFLRHLHAGTLTTLLGAGLVLGFATLVRPFALLLLPFLMAILLLAQKQQGRLRPFTTLAFTAVFLLVVAPWTVRNWFVFQRFVLVASNGGSTFYGGNNERVVTEPRFYGYWLSTTELPHRDLIDATPDEISHDKMEWRLGLDWLREHPGSIPKMCVLKVARLAVGLPDFDGGSRLYYVLRIVGYAPFFVLILIGAIRCLWRRCYWSPPWLVMHGTMLATIATALIFWGSPRFRDANLPVLMVYAVLGLQALVAWKQPAKAAPAAVAGGC
jgi:4-amino-4-deoxy-L-arabinose transferase-like glycosyltransferase